MIPATRSPPRRGLLDLLVVVALVLLPLGCARTLVAMRFPFGFGFACVALVVPLALAWVVAPTARVRTASVAAGFFGAVALVALVSSVPAAAVGAFLSRDVAPGMRDLRWQLAVLVLTPPLAAGVSCALVHESILLARPWRRRSWLGLFAGALVITAGTLLGEPALTRIDVHCARVLVAEGERGVDDLALWRPLAPCLRLHEVFETYRLGTFHDGVGPEELERAFVAFTGRPLSGS